MQNATIQHQELTYLVPDHVVRTDGTGPQRELNGEQGKMLVVTLGIDCVAEQEALLVSLWGSTDGFDWGTKPLLSFPPKYYCGLYSKLLNLANQPEIRFLRVEWKLRRGNKAARPMEFAFYVFAEESGSRISTAVA